MEYGIGCKLRRNTVGLNNGSMLMGNNYNVSVATEMGIRCNSHRLSVMVSWEENKFLQLYDN